MLPIPLSVLYAGLAGVVIALIVATATQRWQLRVFVLLALRLAIGWHFLFEGLHKVNSRYVGPSETNKVFSSERYFVEGEGPLAEKMRRDYLGDPVAIYTARLTQPKPMTPDEFKKLTPEEQAGLCPESVAAELSNAAKASMEGLEKKLADAKAAAEKLKLDMPTPGKEADFEKEQKAKEATAQEKIAAVEGQLKLAANDGRELKAAYAAWVYGAGWVPEKTPPSDWKSKIKYISGESFSLSGPQRLQHIELLQKDLKALEDRQKFELGRGDGNELARTKTARTELLAAKNDLAKDTESFINDLRKEIGLEPMAPPSKEKMKQLDKMTAYGITVIGACILLGLFTPLACLAGAGFLVMTYLTHPTVPWLSLPPMTEGNPLFVNKNIIEALALVVVAVHPTGRWLGLDALWTYFFQPKADEAKV